MRCDGSWMLKRRNRYFRSRQLLYAPRSRDKALALSSLTRIQNLTRHTRTHTHRTCTCVVTENEDENNKKRKRVSPCIRTVSNAIIIPLISYTVKLALYTSIVSATID